MAKDFHCSVCGKDYGRECDLTRHIRASHDDGSLLSYKQSKVDLLYGGVITLMKYYKINGKSLDYVDIYNEECNHFSTLSFGSLLNGQRCAHKDCVSRTKRDAAMKLSKSSEYRDNLSKAVKNAFKDPVKRMNQLIGHANVQRSKHSVYEMQFLGLLALYEINYEYQVPLLIDDVGCVIDFYLPDFKMYVNINSDIFHWFNPDNATDVFKESANAVKEKDKLIRETFSRHNIKFIELYEYSDMVKFITELKEVVQDG